MENKDATLDCTETINFLKRTIKLAKTERIIWICCAAMNAAFMTYDIFIGRYVAAILTFTIVCLCLLLAVYCKNQIQNVNLLIDDVKLINYMLRTSKYFSLRNDMVRESLTYDANNMVSKDTVEEVLKKVDIWCFEQITAIRDEQEEGTDKAEA